MTPMSGLVVSAYCDVGMDRCGNVEPESDGHISKFQHQFEISDTYTTIFEMLDSITYMQSNKTTKEMMFLTLDELVETCRTMRRAPLKFNGWSITLPEIDDRWTKMDWATNGTMNETETDQMGHA
jgi:hypothetical protein